MPAKLIGLYARLDRLLALLPCCPSDGPIAVRLQQLPIGWIARIYACKFFTADSCVYRRQGFASPPATFAIKPVFAKASERVA
jgi:hypothetical protein